MKDFYFSLQLFGEVVHGYSSDDNYSATGDDMQIYGLAGNDTIESMGKSRNLLIGGTGNDVLRLICGDGTLAGGEGNDTFVLTYGPGKSISAVIEDVNPADDGVVVFFDGNDTPQFNHRYDGNNVIWIDSNGLFNVTLKGTNEAKDYATSDYPEEVWTMFKLTNAKRAEAGKGPLTLAENLTQAGMARAVELTQTFSHGRPNGTNFDTILNGYYTLPGENISAGTPPEETINRWMNSSGHYANIVDQNNIGYTHLGVGYYQNDSTQYKIYWAQLFSAAMSNPDSRSADELMQAKVTFTNQNNPGGGGGGSAPVDTGRLNAEDGVYRYNGGNHYITEYAPGNKLQFNAQYAGFELIGNDLHFLSDSGVLNVVNPRDRLIEAIDSSNATVAYAYMAGSGQTLDGSAGSLPELIIGSNDATDVLIAGSGSSSMWGGSGFVTDYMNGGGGRDEFIITAGSGRDEIAGYQSGDVVRFIDNDVVYAEVEGNDLVLHAKESYATVKDCRDRVIDVAYKDGSIVGRGYLSSKGGNLDGRNVSGYQLIAGAPNESNVIAAGNGGSFLWGGTGTSADTLVGGSGTDIFKYGSNEGADCIMNGDASDMVFFYSPISFTSAYKSGNDLVINSTDNNSLTIKNWSEGGLNTFQLSDGSKYRLTQSGDSVTYQQI